MEIFSPPRIIPHAVRQRLRTTTPTNLDLTEDWGATTVTGRDSLEDILRRQKPWMTTLKPPCAPSLIMFVLNERMQHSQGQVRTQGNALELLEVAMWVALTQHQTGRKFLFQHPAYASSWNTQMVSLATGLKGVMLKTVDLSTLGMADEDERSHCRMTTTMTNDSVVADAFRPYRCARDHQYASAGSRHYLGAKEHDRQSCEVLMTALKASSPSGPTRAKTTHDAGSKKRRRARGRLGARRGRATSRTSTSHRDPDQDGESVSSKPGTSIEARVSESVEGSSRETCSARICPT